MNVVKLIIQQNMIMCIVDNDDKITILICKGGTYSVSPFCVNFISMFKFRALHISKTVLVLGFPF